MTSNNRHSSMHTAANAPACLRGGIATTTCCRAMQTSLSLMEERLREREPSSSVAFRNRFHSLVQIDHK
eukprot:scaffold238465_cov38-Prasinocladus_malaysianus.AAC.1